MTNLIPIMASITYLTNHVISWAPGMQEGFRTNIVYAVQVTPNAIGSVKPEVFQMDLHFPVLFTNMLALETNVERVVWTDVRELSARRLVRKPLGLPDTNAFTELPPLPK